MNYDIFGGVLSGTHPFIAAIAADGTTVLETDDLFLSGPISTLGGLNAGAFRGISRPSNDIRFFEFGGSFAALHDLTLVATITPEPSSLALFAAGGVALFAMRRRARG